MSLRRWGVIPALVALLLALPGVALARSQVVYSGNGECRDIALTYDVEFGNITQSLANTVDELGIRTTWFFLGDSVEGYPALVRQVAARHEIGNHTYSHPQMPHLGHGDKHWQLATAHANIARVAGQDPRPIWRPPYGDWDSASLDVAAEEGYPYTVMWSIDTQDWAGPAVETIRRRLVDGAFPGAIALQHGFPPNTVPATRLAVADLRAMGYQFVTVSEILGIGRAERDFGGDTYVVQSGDSFTWIGRCHNISGSRLQAYNGMDSAGPGTELRIPYRDEVIVRVDGERQAYAVYPRLAAGRTSGHVRLAEQLGAAVAWDGTSAVISRAGKTIRITPGQQTATVNGQAVDMGAAAFMVRDRVLASVRFVAEQLAARVSWDGDAFAVDITR